MPGPDQMRISDADREKVAQVLHTAMSEGRITINELEDRLTDVYSAKTVGDLKPVTADLPHTTAAIEPATSRALGLPDSRIGGHPGSGASIAVISGASRKGSWVVPPQLNSFAFWGGVDIDLRQARFAEKHSTITAVAIMGGINIIVPDDVNVEVTGVGFMGAFEFEDRAHTPPASPTAPTIKITGLAFWGGVVVKRKPRKDIPELEA
jgi:hypothetical protein